MKIVPVILILTLCSFCAACASGTRPAVGHTVKTWNDLKWKNIERQEFDYSCGASALATLGRGYFKDPMDELLVMQMILAALSPQEQEERAVTGFSMLDLQRAANNLGYTAVGVKLPPDAIFKLKGPILVILREGDIEHFVVLKGADQRRAYLADSSRGNVRMPLFTFFKQWNGTALALGREGFGLPQEHDLAVKASDACCPEASAIRMLSPL